MQRLRFAGIVESQQGSHGGYKLAKKPSEITVKEIIEALEARDSELASRLVREHTMRLHDHIRERWTRLANKGKARAEIAKSEKT